MSTGKNPALAITSLLLGGMLSITSCQPDEVAPAKEGAPALSSLTEKGQSRIELAKLFAQAVEDPAVLSFLHAEADKQFDRDYDVLIGLVKDQPLPGSEQTLIERLGELAGSQEEVEQLLAAEPLFTLFRPNTEANADRQATPLVAVESQNEVTAYNAQGLTTSLNPITAPKEAVWVAKVNERAVLHGGATARMLDAPGRALGVTSEGHTILLPDAYDPEAFANARSRPLLNYDAPSRDVVETYWEQKGCDPCNARDRIYWKISRQNPYGNSFSNKHAEAIPWIQMAETSTFNNMGGWTEGNVELWFRIFFVAGSPAVLSSNTAQAPGGVPPAALPEVSPVVIRPPGVPPGTPGTEGLAGPPPMAEPTLPLYLDQRLKTVSVRPEDLFEFDEAGNAIATKVYRPENLFYTGWNDLYWGNRIKFYVEEYDPEEQIEKTIVTNTIIGTNFNLKVDGIPIGPAVATPVGKIGFTFGFRFHSSRKVERTVTSVMTTSKGSDFLGEIECLYSDPLISEDVPTAEGSQYREYVYSTGSVEFPFGTRRIAE